MSFLAPNWLWALLLVPALAAGYVLLQRRRQRYAVRFTNLALLSNLVPHSPRWRRHVPPALFLTALAALLVAVARPQTTQEVPREQASVVLAVDVSGSMRAEDVEPTRLAAAQKAANAFLDAVPDEFRVGLVTFSTAAQLVTPPTEDHETVRRAVAGLEADGGTAIGDAIALAAELDTGELAAEREGEDGKPPLVVLLLSDGAPSPDTLDPIEAAGRAKEAGIPVYTVALGTDQGTVEIPDEFGTLQTVEVPPDRETLAEIARTTGAATFSAPTEQALEAVYERLGSSIGYDEEPREITWMFAAGGIVLLLGAGVLSALWFGRLP